MLTDGILEKAVDIFSYTSWKTREMNFLVSLKTFGSSLRNMRSGFGPASFRNNSHSPPFLPRQQGRRKSTWFLFLRPMAGFMNVGADILVTAELLSMWIAPVSPRFDGKPNGLKASDCYEENASSPFLSVPSKWMSPHSYSWPLPFYSLHPDASGKWVSRESDLSDW